MSCHGHRPYSTAEMRTADRAVLDALAIGSNHNTGGVYWRRPAAQPAEIEPECDCGCLLDADGDCPRCSIDRLFERD